MPERLFLDFERLFLDKDSKVWSIFFLMQRSQILQQQSRVSLSESPETLSTNTVEWQFLILEWLCSY